MRYFKYDGSHPDSTSYKVQYAALTVEEKRQYRKAGFLRKIGAVLGLVVGAVAFIGLIYFIEQIPEPEWIVFKLLDILAGIVLWLFAIIASVIVGVLVALPFGSKQEARAHAAKRQLLTKACDHLREYYRLQEPCVVTKCYECHDKRFVDHDVCLFFVENELHITTNLKNGFFRMSKDLGCYALEREEITVSTVSYKDISATEITAGDARFLLGQRAKAFVERSFENIIDENRRTV